MKPLLSRALAALLLVLSASPVQAAGADAPRCRYVNVAKLPLQYTGPGLALTTTGVINGTPALMLVDTGASDTWLTRTGTERRGMRLSNLGRVARGIGGMSSIYQTRIKEFVAGPARSERGHMRVLSDFGHPPSYDAILGAPFLLQTDLELSLASKELKFFQPVDCADQFLAYWDADALVIPFESNYGDSSPNPRFTVLVNGQKMRAIIDSGASSTVIALEAAKRAGLKLDAAGVKRRGHAVGVGDEKVAYWHAVFKSVQIGEETIENAELDVLERLEGIDVLLGADFLRAHRVLFAMSQRKIYFSYVGGHPFGQRRKLEPWLQAEADAGNGDAQMALARMYRHGDPVRRDDAAAAAWLEKAALNGNPDATLYSGHALLREGRAQEAAPRLRLALDKLPSDRDAALWLYLARLRTGQAELGRSELTTAFARGEDDEWPAPIADFYLGKLTAPELLKQAERDRELGARRSCNAIQAMMALYEAQDDSAQAQALAASRKEQCARAEAADQDDD